MPGPRIELLCGLERALARCRSGTSVICFSESGVTVPAQRFQPLKSCPVPTRRSRLPIATIALTSFHRAKGATPEALIVAFCRLAKLLFRSFYNSWLVGAVGIEPYT